MERSFIAATLAAFSSLQEELKACAAHGVAAATLPALIDERPGAAPVFWEEFEVCTRYTEWIRAELSLRTFCRPSSLRPPDR